MISIHYTRYDISEDLLDDLFECRELLRYACVRRSRDEVRMILLHQKCTRQITVDNIGIPVLVPGLWSVPWNVVGKVVNPAYIERSSFGNLTILVWHATWISSKKCWGWEICVRAQDMILSNRNVRAHTGTSEAFSSSGKFASSSVALISRVEVSRTVATPWNQYLSTQSKSNTNTIPFHSLLRQIHQHIRHLGTLPIGEEWRVLRI